jgi:hypothetical protein
MLKLRPEIKNPIYYVHLVLISIIVLGILQIWKGGNMLNFYTVAVSTILIGVADITVHTILGLD